MSTNKPRVIKDYEKLDIAIQEQIKLAYADGFSEYLISYNNKDGVKVSALPFETDDTYYMIRMSKSQALSLISDDDDYDDDGNLKEEIKDEYEDKYSDIDYMSEYIGESEGDDDQEDDD